MAGRLIGPTLLVAALVPVPDPMADADPIGTAHAGTIGTIGDGLSRTVMGGANPSVMPGTRFSGELTLNNRRPDRRATLHLTAALPINGRQQLRRKQAKTGSNRQEGSPGKLLTDWSFP